MHCGDSFSPDGCDLPWSGGNNVINVRSSPAATIVEIDAGPLNMLDLESVAHLREAIATSESASMIVLTSTPRAFCAGFDLKRILSEPSAYTGALLTAFEDLIETLVSRAVPVIAALPGHAIGAGYLLAAACDYRIMVAGRVGVPESRVGFPVPPGSLEVLRAVAGDVTRELVYGGELWEIDLAREASLIDEVSPLDELIDRAVAVGTRWSTPSPKAFRLHKQLLTAPLLARMTQARARLGGSVADYWQSDEARIAASAYLESLRGR